MDNGSDLSLKIDALVEEFFEQLRAGRQPDLETFVARLPEAADEIRELCRTLALIENLKIDGQSSQPSHKSRPAEPMPDRIGDFVILRELGRGGMGIVYEAIQESLQRRVALKLLNFGSRGAESRWQRFRHEARAAARLHHTNIVSVFGVGEADGTPFYAMQLIEGRSGDCLLESLQAGRTSNAPTRHRMPTVRPRAETLFESPPPDATDVKGTATNQRVASPVSSNSQEAHFDVGEAVIPDPEREPKAYFRFVADLGMQVADALDYAHRQGVLHRDIKPANLLFDGKGTVWVTDFGVAKTDDSDHRTETGDIVGTLRYMAPERLTGASLPASDTYSLGLTLYEFLTRRAALVARSDVHVLDQVLKEVLLPPTRVDGRIPRDLEVIVLKAAAKNPRDRYATAGELSKDLHRFLAGLPVRARAAGPMLRAIRWSQRNPLAATLAALAVLVTAVGFGGVTWQWRRAEANRQRVEESFRQARSAVDEFFTLTSENRLLDVPGMQSVRRDLLRSAHRYYQQFIEEQGSDPSVRADLALTLYRVGVLDAELGSANRAVVSFEQAAELQRDLMDDDAGDASVREQLLETYLRLAELERRPRLNYASSQKYLDQALEVSNALAKNDPGKKLERLTAAVWLERGQLLADMGRRDAAQESLEQAASICRPLVGQSDRAEEDRYTFGRIAVSKAKLEGELGHPDAALAAAREAVESFRELCVASPTVIAYRRELGLSLGEVVMSQGRGEAKAEADQALDESRALWTTLVDENPEVVDFQLYLAQTDGLRAASAMLRGDVLVALKAHKLAMDGVRQLLEKTPRDPYLKLILIYLYNALAVAPPGFSPSPAMYEESIDALDKMLSVPPGRPTHWTLRGVCHANLGHWDQAKADFEHSLELPSAEWPDRVRLALLRFVTNDRQGYRQLCTQLLDETENSSLALAKEMFVQLIVLDPASFDDNPRALEFVARQSRENPLSPAFAAALGVLKAQHGESEEATQALERARAMLKAAEKRAGAGTFTVSLPLVMNELSLAQVYSSDRPMDSLAALHQAESTLQSIESYLGEPQDRQQAPSWEYRALAQCVRKQFDEIADRLRTNRPAP